MLCLVCCVILMGLGVFGLVVKDFVYKLLKIGVMVVFEIDMYV